MTEKPTTEELYEQAKRVLRNVVLDYNLIKEGQPAFIIACKRCGMPFSDEAEVGMIGEHAELAHGIDTEKEQVTLDLIWIGEGPPPKPQRSNDG